MEFMLEVLLILKPWLIFISGLAIGSFLGLLLTYRARGKDEADERRKHFHTVGTPVADGIDHNYGWYPNSRGMLIFQQQYVPKGKLKGVVGLCHGYSESSSMYIRVTAMKFCAKGFAVLSYDAEGHGFSDGLHVFVNDLQDINHDVNDYFTAQMQQERFRKLPFFIYGESMGGAVAFNLCTRHTIKSLVHGVVLICPMVKVSDEVKPPQFIVDILMKVARYLPLAPIAPVKDIMEKAVKRRDILEQMKKNPLAYRMLPRLATAIAMMEATEHIEKHMEDLRTPVVILHGENDEVTDPKLSQELYQRCSSKDKTIFIYPGVWHNLMHGEPDEDIEKHMKDVTDWLGARLKSS
mmetsp:Transcript_28819/g.48404  ORF Transcript_28819/g.48404 Transcript_28819/m.48404 type:complete len:351 (+) Transcript_28819:38-1090(+)